MNLRPVGHVTDLIRDVERWQVNREKLGMEVGTLMRVAIYLEEYRDLINEAKRNGIHRIPESARASRR